jgi:hypothetical protein
MIGFLGEEAYAPPPHACAERTLVSFLPSLQLDNLNLPFYDLKIP